MAFKKDMQQLYENFLKGENLFKNNEVTHDPQANPSAAQESFMTYNNANLVNVQQGEKGISA